MGQVNFKVDGVVDRYDMEEEKKDIANEAVDKVSDATKEALKPKEEEQKQNGETTTSTKEEEEETFIIIIIVIIIFVVGVVVGVGCFVFWLRRWRNNEPQISRLQEEKGEKNGCLSFDNILYG